MNSTITLWDIYFTWCNFCAHSSLLTDYVKIGLFQSSFKIDLKLRFDVIWNCPHSWISWCRQSGVKLKKKVFRTMGKTRNFHTQNYDYNWSDKSSCKFCKQCFIFKKNWNLTKMLIYSIYIFLIWIGVYQNFFLSEILPFS